MPRRDTPSEHHIALWLTPSAALAIAIMAAKASGNDKAPFMVLALLAAFTMLLGVAVLALFFGGGKGAGWLKPLCLGALLPLTYAGAVLILSRYDVIDSLTWLGLR